MRDLTTHQVEGVTNPLVVQCEDLTRYLITGFNTEFHPKQKLGDSVEQLAILFQTGDPRVVGINGVTMEALLAVVADRLQGFQDGPYPAAENQEAIEHLNKALDALHRRTQRWQQVHMPTVEADATPLPLVTELPSLDAELWRI